MFSLRHREPETGARSRQFRYLVEAAKLDARPAEGEPLCVVCRGAVDRSFLEAPGWSGIPLSGSVEDGTIFGKLQDLFDAYAHWEQEVLALTRVSSSESSENMIKHVVIFRYRPLAMADQIRQVTDAFRELKTKVPGILAFAHGINNSPEGKNLGFTHVYELTFEDTQARDTYLPHPAHKQFVEFLGQLDIVEDVFVVDYISEE